MRRMLDPKTIEGSVKLYCHFIRVAPRDDGEICFNYTSTDETKLTKKTIVSALKGKNLICIGYVKINGAVKTPEYIYISGNELATKWVDLTSLASGVKRIDIDYLEDFVSPVD